MSAFLLQSAGDYAATKYGALVPTRNGSLLPGQDAVAAVPSAPVS